LSSKSNKAKSKTIGRYALKTIEVFTAPSRVVAVKLVVGTIVQHGYRAKHTIRCVREHVINKIHAKLKEHARTFEPVLTVFAGLCWGRIFVIPES
jgi:hypothetical protein